MAFLPQISVAVIDPDGYRWPVTDDSIEVFNVTTQSALFDVFTDEYGIIAEQDIGESAGDVIELSHTVFPKTARFVLGATQDDAYGNAKSDITTYIADDLSTGETAATTVDVYFTDESDPSKGPQFLGEAKVGGITRFPYQTQIAKELKVFGVGKSDSFLKTEDAFKDEQGFDLSVGAPRATFSPVFDEFTDVTTSGTTRENLYSNQADDTYLVQTGDKIFFRYAGKYAANTNDNKYLFLNVAGDDIGESGGQSINGEKWEIDGFIMRTSDSVFRYESEFTTTGVAPVLREGEVTGLDLDNDPIDFLLDARTVDAAGDVTVTIATAWFIPAAPITSYNITYLGDNVTYGGDQVIY